MIKSGYLIGFIGIRFGVVSFFISNVSNSITHTVLGNDSMYDLLDFLEVVGCACRNFREKDFFRDSSSKDTADFIE